MKIFSGLQIKFKSVKTIKICSKYELILSSSLKIQINQYLKNKYTRFLYQG